MSKIHILDENKRWGVSVLLRWVIDEYKTSSSVNGKRMWKERTTFLARLQKKTHYNRKEKIIYNKLRDEFLSKKNQETT